MRSRCLEMPLTATSTDRVACVLLLVRVRHRRRRGAMSDTYQRLSHVQVCPIRTADHALHPLTTLHPGIHQLREHLE